MNWPEANRNGPLLPLWGLLGRAAVALLQGDVLASLDAAIVGMHATGSTDHMLTGLGVGLPNHSWEMSSYYVDFAFAGQGWMDFLEAYWAAAGSI